jgi:hypothetical protein
LFIGRKTLAEVGRTREYDVLNVVVFVVVFDIGGGDNDCGGGGGGGDNDGGIGDGDGNSSAGGGDDSDGCCRMFYYDSVSGDMVARWYIVKCQSFGLHDLDVSHSHRVISVMYSFPLKVHERLRVQSSSTIFKVPIVCSFLILVLALTLANYFGELFGLHTF